MDGYACLLPCVNAEVMNRTPDGHSTPRGWLVSRPTSTLVTAPMTIQELSWRPNHPRGLHASVYV